MGQAGSCWRHDYAERGLISVGSSEENAARQLVMDNAAKMHDQYAHDNSVFGAKITTCPASIDRENLYDLRCFDVEGAIEIPDVMLACVSFLKRKNRLRERGLFRIPGDYKTILRLKMEMSNFKEKPLDADALEAMNADPHSIANVFKSFLKELAEPLLTYEMYDPFVGAAKEGREVEATNLIYQLPNPNRNVCLFLLAFLAEVSAYEEYTQMSLEALAVLFAPNMLRPRNETVQTLMEDATPKKAVVMAMIKLALKHTHLSL